MLSRYGWYRERLPNEPKLAGAVDPECAPANRFWPKLGCWNPELLNSFGQRGVLRQIPIFLLRKGKNVELKINRISTWDEKSVTS